MTRQENDFSTNRLLFPSINPNHSSHESMDSGCYDSEVHHKTNSKPFDTFSLITTALQQPQAHQKTSFPHSKSPSVSKQQRCSITGGKDENASGVTKIAEVPQTGGGASYKYLTWREKDRRRRFREEWKHLWLVVPHGMYEVMCLVCHKIMTQRKLDTIKRHTIRRHAELLSMSESERQRLYHDLIAQYFRRGGDFCGEGDPFNANSVPRLRQMGPRGDRTESAVARRHSRLPPDVSSPPYRTRMNLPRRCEIDKPSLSCSPATSDQIFKNPSTTLPMNLKNFENILSNGELHSFCAKYMMGLHPAQIPPRGDFDPYPSQLWRRNPLSHSGMGIPHAFQTFKKMSPPISSIPSTLTAQKSPPEILLDSLNSRAPLDMSTSVTATVQASPNDLSMRKCSTTPSETGTSLTERLIRLVSTWDTAAINPRNMTALPPPPPPPPQFLSPLLLSTQSDSSALLLNR